MDMDPSIIWGVYNPKIMDGHGSVNYLGGVHPQTIDGHGSVNYFGGVEPPNN